MDYSDYYELTTAAGVVTLRPYGDSQATMDTLYIMAQRAGQPRFSRKLN
jgi:hypothetical protein